MNPNNPGQHYRGPPNPGPMNQGPRPGYDMRNGGPPPGAQPSPGLNGRFPPAQTMSRAEKFEDEKRRIMDSCFGSKDEQDQSLESYITHIRVNEDEEYPSSPAPLSQPARAKKPRVIMVAVRKTGRVRVHKGRENANGTFSIGKTWNLDDLRRIESFTNMVPQTAEQRENKERAQDTGFVVTMQKPYYWQASTAKEKDFFIFSLIKIYRKYTNGKLPDLDGFSAQELDQLGASANAMSSPPQPRPQQNGGPTVPMSRARAPSQEPPPRARPPDVRPSEISPILPNTSQYQLQTNRGLTEPSPHMRRRPSQDSQNSQGQMAERTLHSAQNSDHRVLHSAASRDRVLRHGTSNERIRLPGGFPSSDSLPTQGPLTHRSKRSESPGSQRTIATSAAANSRTPSEHRYGQPSAHENSQLTAQPPASGRSSSEQVTTNGYGAEARLRGGAQHRSEGSEERPRTATKDVDMPPALSVRSPKHRRPSVTNDSASHTERGEMSMPPSIRSTDSRTGSYRSVSRQTAQSDQESNSTEISSFIKNRTSKPGSRDISEQPHQSRFEAPAISKDDIAISKAAEPDSFSSFPPPEQHIEPENPEPKPPAEEEIHRPGLGPMIKKKGNKELASKFRKAATAYNAFKPRGIGNDTKSPTQDGTGDGITGVFQAPSLLRKDTDDSIRPKTPTIKVDSRPATPDAKREIPPTSDPTFSPPKQVAISAPDPNKLQEPANEAVSKDFMGPMSQNVPPTAPPVPAQDERRKKRRSDHSAKYAKSLGIGPGILEGRTLEIEAVLSDFGWAEEDSKTTFEELETGIRRELARVEAGSWLGAVDSSDDRTAALGDMMDKVLAECEELDCLLTLYNVELGSLSEDVAYIEAQSQGLQVQTANQKLLHTELRNLLDTISISSQQLKVLKDASLTKPRGIREVESTLGQLFSAMRTIDPKLRSEGSRPGTSDQSSLHRQSHNGYNTSDLSSMNAVREKEHLYRRESREFVQRLKQYLAGKFRECESQTLDVLEEARKTTLPKGVINDRMREKPKSSLWIYRPLILFAREIEPPEWNELMRMYEASAKKPYIDEFRENVAACKRNTKKATGDETEVLFTHQEKETESLGRKLTVKRTKTVRSDGPSRVSGGTRSRDDQQTAYEGFARALTDEAHLICMEQNFIVDFFHLSALSNEDFLDAIKTDPESRQSTNLSAMKSFDPDRAFSRKVQSTMEELFGFWAVEIQGMIDWATKQDQLNTVGMLCALESQLHSLEDTNQEFLTATLTPLHDRLVSRFTRFIEEQIHAIEDTKVKIKKRRGLITFMKVFPGFSATMENTLPPDPRLVNHLPVRGIVNEGYNKLNKAMFESLKFIAKELPAVAAGAGSTTASSASSTNALNDPEDKEALNYHILLIENMNHYVDEVAPRGNPVLEDWVRRARAEYTEHLTLYLSAIIRRPLGKLLDFIESTETVVHNNSSSGLAPAAIAQRPSHSKHVAKKVLGQYDAKEVRRGIETLRKRVEKHFAEGEGAGVGVGGVGVGISGRVAGGAAGEALLGKVWNEAEREYLSVLERTQKIVKDVYENEVEVGWGRVDVQGAFRR